MRSRVKVEPYKLGCHRGFWYLIGSIVVNGKREDRIRAFSVYKIKQFRVLDEGFDSVPEEVKRIEVFKPYFPVNPHSQHSRGAIQKVLDGGCRGG